MNRLARLCLACAAALGAAGHPPAIHADTIVLRNGQELRGRVRSSGDTVRIDLDVGGTVTVARGDIARVVVDAAEPTDADATAVSPERLKRLEARERLHVLIAALGDPKEAARSAAERDLTLAGRPALPFLRAALDEGTAADRPALLRILSAIGDPAALPRVRAILANPKDTALHVEAAAALANIGGHGAAPELAILMLDAKDDAVALECLKALAAMRSPIAAPFVLEAQRRAPLRATARKAIARWGDPVLLPHLARLLRASPPAGRPLVAEWLVGLLTPGHVALYSALLDDHADDKAVLKALRAGAARLHDEFPVIGDVALLSATQTTVRERAHELLKARFRAPNRSDRPADWKAEAAEATAPRLLLVPVGSASRTTVRDLAAALGGALGRPVEAERRAVAFPTAPPGPHDVRRLLAYLDRRQRDDFRSARIVGLTAAEVTVPGRDSALAPTGPGRAVVLSVAHLGAGQSRGAMARTLALHALARSMAIPPCGAPGCPSGPVYQPADLATLRPRYCPACSKAFAAAWDAEAAAARFDYANAAQRLSRLAGKTNPALRAAAACMYERALDVAAARKEWEAYAAMAVGRAAKALAERRMALLGRAAPPGRRPAP